MSALTTIIAGAGLLYAGYSGERGATAQRHNTNRQREAQRRAEVQAAGEARAAELANKKAQAQQPDLGTLLADAQRDALKGPGSTMLTGGGLDQSKLKLGQRSLLAGA